MAPCFDSGPGFFQKLSWLWSSLLLSLQAVSPQPTAVPSLGPLSKYYFPAPSTPPHQETHDLGWGVCRAVAWTICAVLTLSCLPQTGCSVPLQSPEGPLLSQLNSLLWMGFSECGDLSSPSLPHQGCWSLPISSFLFFSFFHPTQLCGNFSCTFRCLRSSTSVQQVLCENCSICRCILDVLVRRGKFASSYSAILTPPSRKS